MTSTPTTLDSFQSDQRQQAFAELIEQVRAGKIQLPDPTGQINLHCHTFYSYNSYGYSPCHYAWLAKEQGLATAGIVDFDVLDGLDEFLLAADQLDLKACVGMETRVFVPEFANREMTSPGEPGITYHMGVGFVKMPTDPSDKAFLARLKDTAQLRNRELISRVNPYLAPVEIDYQNDVLPLTPNANPTERHICLAYARKARQHFTNETELAKFWSDKLATPADKLDLPEGKNLINTLRAKTMKQGGVGYVKPDKGSFPKMEEVNRFVLANGAIPTLTWLNGLSEGEQAIEELLDVAISTGVAAVNIIPDRNFTPGVKDEKLEKLNRFVEIADRRHLPIFVGTEMNSPGQKFVDAFETAELKKHLPSFLTGAMIAYGHTILQRYCQLGYCSEWANARFDSPADKNEFYEIIGRFINPSRTDRLKQLNDNSTPEEILKIAN